MSTITSRKVRVLVDSIIYGPVASRRFGNSLGINLSGSGKYCSFSCPYCFRGFNQGKPHKQAFLASLPQPQSVIQAVEHAMTNLSRIDDWTLAGNAEPTDHPEFSIILEQLIALRNRHWPDIQISVLTNGMGLIPRIHSNYRQILDSLRKVERPCFKLDAATPVTWRYIAAPAYKVTLEEWLAHTTQMTDFYIQTMLLKGRIDNTTDREIEALASCYRQLKPRAVQLYTINKPPADSRLYAVCQEELKQLEQKLRHLVTGEKFSITAFS